MRFGSNSQMPSRSMLKYTDAHNATCGSRPAGAFGDGRTLSFAQPSIKFCSTTRKGRRSCNAEDGAYPAAFLQLMGAAVQPGHRPRHRQASDRHHDGQRRPEGRRTRATPPASGCRYGRTCGPHPADGAGVARTLARNSPPRGFAEVTRAICSKYRRAIRQTPSRNGSRRSSGAR